MQFLAQEGGSINAVFRSFENNSLWVILVVALLALGFAYYLRQERLFRSLYAALADEVVNNTATVSMFSMDIRPYLGTTPRWARTLFSRAVLPIPVVLAIIAVGFTLLGPALR